MMYKLDVFTLNAHQSTTLRAKERGKISFANDCSVDQFCKLTSVDIKEEKKHRQAFRVSSYSTYFSIMNLWVIN